MGQEFAILSVADRVGHLRKPVTPEHAFGTLVDLILHGTENLNMILLPSLFHHLLIKCAIK